MNSSSGDGFYVGYLPVPRRHNALLLGLVPMLVIGGAVVAVLIAGQQRDPGSGVWQFGIYKDRTGTLVEKPYPMLATDDGRLHVLVSTTKRGVAARVAGLNGRRVTLNAALLERSGRSMLELADADEAVRTVDGAPRMPTTSTVTESAVLVGEIIDPKCYLGAMKPGGGRTHKACAILCIRGGIPPMFVVRTADGGETFYLLSDDEGGAMPVDAIRRYIGEPVRLTGRVSKWGNLRLLRVDPATIALR